MLLNICFKLFMAFLLKMYNNEFIFVSVAIKDSIGGPTSVHNFDNLECTTNKQHQYEENETTCCVKLDVFKL